MAHVKFTDSELETQISEIMRTFNFEKLHEHMLDKDHKWYMGSAGMRVPDVDDLRWTARDLLTKAAYDKDNTSNVGTGGFMAYKLSWGMQLTFQLFWS